MDLRTLSIRTKLLLLVTGVAFLVGTVSAVYSSVSSGRVLREQMVKRGMYIASNLAYNSKYGVLTEDRPLLTQLLEGAIAAQAGQGSDVKGAMIRDAKGVILAQKGLSIRDLPLAPATTMEDRDVVADNGEDVILFRAPVTTAAAGEFGAEAAGTKAPEELKGGVEMAQQQRGILLRTFLVALALFAAGSLLGWYLTGKWLDPVRHMVEVASAVAKGDLTETLSIDSSDEIGVLARSLQEMVANLRRVVDNIQEASVQVASSAGQISANAKLINQGAQSQAQAAEETSTSMEEMAASIQTVAGNAQSLATYVEETSSSINQMGTSIEEVARSSSTLAGTITEASATIEEMTVSIDQMAKNLENLAGTVTETSATVEELTTFIASVAHNAESLSQAAQKTAHTVAETRARETRRSDARSPACARSRRRWRTPPG